MSAFNTIKANVVCPNCDEFADYNIQFKYGNTRQKSYQVGDKLLWGGNDIGLPGKKKVSVESIGGPCAICEIDGIEFDVIVENDVLTLVVPIGMKRGETSSEGFMIIED